MAGEGSQLQGIGSCRHAEGFEGTAPAEGLQQGGLLRDDCLQEGDAVGSHAHVGLQRVPHQQPQHLQHATYSN